MSAFFGATEFVTSFDGCKIAYRLHSSGYLKRPEIHPIILFQGWSGVKEDWRSLAIRLMRFRPGIIMKNEKKNREHIFYLKNFFSYFFLVFLIFSDCDR